MTRAPALVRYATRYAGSLHDAEDAYQRAMEIALTRAPVTEDPRFLAWLHTVVRNEALVIARARRREVPSEAAVAAGIDRAADADGSQRAAETRERYRALQDALGGLSHAQRQCLMLQTAGASYSAICEITGYTRRKVERSVLEGRANLHAWEVRLDEGGVCAEAIAAMERVMAGTGDRADDRAVRRHTRHCRACRTAMRTRRQSDQWLAGLVPPALLVGAEAAPAADPTPMLAYWERASASLGLRSTQLMQLGTELYGAATGKVGLAVATVAAAGAAGVPLLADALGPSAQPSAPARAAPVAATPTTDARPSAAPIVVVAPPARRRTPPVAAPPRRTPAPPRVTTHVRTPAAPRPAPHPRPHPPFARGRPPARRHRRHRPHPHSPWSSDHDQHAQRSAAPALGLALSVTLAPVATATDGAHYGYGSSIWAAGSQFSASRGGEVWTIGAPALNPAFAGSKWEMNWGCPVLGSVIAQVSWSALRTAPPSHMELEVLADRGRVWAIPDAAIPQSPAGGQAYAVNLPGSTCNVHLRLLQAASVAQHKRTYFIDSPRMLVRDVAAPGAAITSVPAGWLNAGQGHATIAWSTSDNFGSDGVRGQRLSIAGHIRYGGEPGVGAHGVAASLDGIGDGQHGVRLEVDGDGTAGAAAAATIHVDRTAPTISSVAANDAVQPGHADLAWVAQDAVSGVASEQVEVSAATDGSPAGPWVQVAAVAGGGAHQLNGVATTAVPDGVHAWRVRAADVAGNGAQAAGPGHIVVDTTPPQLKLAPMPDGHVRTLRLAITQSDNLEAELGVGPTEIEVNEAADGGDSGRWIPLATVDAGPGAHTAPLDLGRLADGPHQLRVRARNGGPLGAQLVTVRTAVANVDASGPQLEGVRFRPAGPSAVEVSWIAHDARSGVAGAALQRLGPAGWQTLAEAEVGNGAGTLRADGSGLPEGAHELRLVVRDRAGNTSEARSGAGVLALDHTPPQLADLRLERDGGWRAVWSQSDPDGGFGSCETTIEVSGPGTSGAWRELVSRQLGGGTHAVRLPVAGLAPGAYRVRVQACDAAGNRTAAVVGGLVLGASSDRASRLRSARLSLRVGGARLERRRGHQTYVVRRAAARPFVVDGRLRDAQRRPMGRRLVHAVGHGGRVLGRTRTRADGRFRLVARPLAGGPVRVGVPVGRALLPKRANAAIRLLVRPRVRLTAVTPFVRRGEQALFSGRVIPAPRRLGGSRRKAIVLKWRDPIRNRWRPVVNARLRRDGRFRLGWRFGVSGMSIPMRVRVPAGRGWPLQPGRSRVVSVRVGGR